MIVAKKERTKKKKKMVTMMTMMSRMNSLVEKVAGLDVGIANGQTSFLLSSYLWDVFGYVQ